MDKEKKIIKKFIKELSNLWGGWNSDNTKNSKVYQFQWTCSNYKENVWSY